MQSLHPVDRFVRTALGIALLLAGFFWLSAGLQIGAYLLAAVLLLTAAIATCPLYRLLGLRVGSPSGGPRSRLLVVALGAVLVLELLGGAYASVFFTRKFFLEDFNAMNDHYKQTLFLTGKNERAQANAKYDLLVPAFQAFSAKYADYRPYALRSDGQFGADLARVQGMITGVEGMVRTGDLHEAHLALEKVRPVFQDMFKRNGFSLLAVALVDFHDAMELMLDAAAVRDTNKLQALYPEVSDKLKAVEAEASDAEIQAIRTRLDALAALAATQDAKALEGLPAAADALKSSFVKVYLKRG